MKLSRPFFRLPLRFDAERLRAEVEALPAGAWSRQPRDLHGNSAARLVTVGGAENDGVAGAMQPTPALLASPYLQQVLAAFDTVWSRCRLVRIESGVAMPPRSDASHHAFHHAQLRVPVATGKDVQFHGEGQDVHMAAGEAWVVDDWRRHAFENPGQDACVHVVAETTGTSAFWRLVQRGQSAGFEALAPETRHVAYDPTAQPSLAFERFSIAAVMAPAEVEQLTGDLLADLAPPDARPESVAAVNAFRSAVRAFCRDWRATWVLNGDTPEGRPAFGLLADALRRELRALPAVRVASTGRHAYEVMVARVLAYAHERAGEEPTLSGLPTVEVPQIELPTVEVPQIKTVEVPHLKTVELPLLDVALAAPEPAPVAPPPEPYRPPVIERPVIILSAPRAGSTLLFETLAQATCVYTIGGESHQLIESIAALRPGRGVVNSNRLTRRDATTAIVAELRQRFTGRIQDRDQQPPASGARVRLLEKTPKNALRVPFLLEVFPDAQFVFLQRDPRTNLSSMMQAWRGKGWVTYRGLPGWPGPWSLLLPPGYERLQGKPLEDIVAFQWRVANETILDDLADLPRERWTTVRYESLLADPRAEIGKLLEFAGLEMDARLEAYLSKPLPLSKYTQTQPDPDKWKQNEKEIARVMPQLASIAGRLDG